MSLRRQPHRKLTTGMTQHLPPNLNLSNSFSQISVQEDVSFDIRAHAFRLMLDNVLNNAGHDIGLISTTDHHTNMDVELGET